MRLEEMSPEDLIDPSWLDSYEQQMTPLWGQLVQLNLNIFILKKLAAFPFDCFEPVRVHQYFWPTVLYSLAETSVMIIWRVALDQHKKALTLPKLVDGIIRNARNEEYRSLLEDRLRSVDFERAVAALRPRVEALRHKLVAHFDRHWVTKVSPEQILRRSLHLSELVELTDKVNSLFDVLCFGQRALLPPDYLPGVQPPAGADTRTDIERLLDCVARESSMLNMPEQLGDAWPGWRDRNVSPECLEEMNRYRVRFGLPKA